MAADIVAGDCSPPASPDFTLGLPYRKPPLLRNPLSLSASPLSTATCRMPIDMFPRRPHRRQPVGTIILPVTRPLANDQYRFISRRHSE